MPRRARNEEPGAIHHVVPQGNGRRPFVLDDHDRQSYLSRFAGIAAQREWVVHVSCLLDTHHHAVVETPSPDLSDGMRRVLGGHASWFNVRHGRAGAVFGERFWSTRVDDDAHFLRACLYTLLNPVAAGLARHPRDWPWSSYRVAVVECPSRIHAILGGTADDARDCFLQLLDEGAQLIHERRAADRAATLAIADELGIPHVRGRG